MTTFLRPLAYFFLLTCVVVAFLWAGVIPMSLTVSQRIVASLEEDFGSSYRLSEDGRIVQLTIRSADFGPEQCQQLLSLKGLESLDLSGTSVDDASLGLIAQIKQLKSLRLDDTSVTDKGLQQLAATGQLTELSLSRCNLGTVTRSGLGSLTSLETLNLMGTPMTASAVEALEPLSGLKKLYLGNTGLTSSCLASLSGLPDLQLLNLTGLELVQESDFALLGTFPRLQTLYLDRSEITDEAFAEFVAAMDPGKSRLSAVFLEGCPLTDQSSDQLKKLVALPAFSKLRLTGTQISRGVFEEIRKTSPEVSYAHGAANLTEA